MRQSPEELARDPEVKAQLAKYHRPASIHKFIDPNAATSLRKEMPKEIPTSILRLQVEELEERAELIKRKAAAIETILIDLLPLVPLWLLRSRQRYSEVVELRFRAYRLLREAGFSLSVIGRFLHRDHGTVLHGLRVLADRERV
jgi:chromosomal replication initiation ATPase DnaA